MKFLAIFKEQAPEKLNEEAVRTFFLKVYKLYKKELFQPFSNTLEENKFSKHFHLLLDSLVVSTAIRG